MMTEETRIFETGMNNKEATKVIQTMLAVTDLRVRSNLTADMVKACRMATKALEQTEWISVKDRLPTKRGRYWITLEYTESGVRTVDNESFNEEKGKFNNQRYYEMQGYKIIAWQEYVVPSPYKGE